MKKNQKAGGRGKGRRANRKSLSYSLTCRFREGRHRLDEAWDRLSGEECKAQAADWLDLLVLNGVVESPSYRKVRENLSRYCSDDGVRREYERQRAAYAACRKIAAFVDSGEAGSFGVPYGEREFVLVEAEHAA